jgi:hypothetical protein
MTPETGRPIGRMSMSDGDRRGSAAGSPAALAYAGTLPQGQA